MWHNAFSDIQRQSIPEGDFRNAFLGNLPLPKFPPLLHCPLPFHWFENLQHMCSSGYQPGLSAGTAHTTIRTVSQPERNAPKMLRNQPTLRW